MPRAVKPEEELTAEDLKPMTDAQLAMMLKFVAIGFGDIEAARVCKEAADRLANKARG